MLALEIILISFSFISYIGYALLKIKNNNKYKYLNSLFLLFSILSSFVLLIDEIASFKLENFMFVLFIVLGIFGYVANEIIDVKVISEKKTLIKNILNFIFPIFIIFGIISYYGFGYLQVLIMLVFAFIFYATKYIFKSNENDNILFMFLSIIISDLLSSSLFILILSSGIKTDILTGTFMLIGSLIYYLTAIIILEKDLFNKEIVVKNKNVYSLAIIINRLSCISFLIALIFII